MTTGDRVADTPTIRASQDAGTAADLWVQARGRVDFGRPATGLRMGARALERLRREHLPAAKAAVLRSRILVTMADAQVELGRTTQANELLDQATKASPTALPMVQASRGVLLARTGRLSEALEQLDAGVEALSAAERPSANLVRALLWRGLLHLTSRCWAGWPGWTQLWPSPPTTWG